nr:unnamed protein product [Spirometra erinaceieuropaei]
MVSDKTDKLSCTSEAIWLTIKAPCSPSLDILTVYRPPRNDPTSDAPLIEDLERFSIRSKVLIMGDFNAPLIDWSSAYASGPDHAFDRRLLDMTFKLFLTQHVSFPTRVREGQQSNCLDLLLTKSLDSVDEVQCLPPLGRSDHVVLLWEYSIFSLPEQATRVRRNIWRGDFAQMKAELNTINWESAFSGDIIKDWDWFIVKPESEDRPEATLNSENTKDVTPSDFEVKKEQPESQLNVESMEAFVTTEDDDDIPNPTTAATPEGSPANAADRVSNVKSTLAPAAEILGLPADDRPSTFSRQDSLNVGPGCQENQV